MFYAVDNFNHLDREVFDKIHIWNYHKEALIKDSYLEHFSLLWFWNPDFHQLFACDNFECVFYKIFLYLSRSNWTESFLSVLMDFLILTILKNFLIEVDWGQKLSFYDIRSLLASWSCWFQICVSGKKTVPSKQTKIFEVSSLYQLLDLI